MKAWCIQADVAITLVGHGVTLLHIPVHVLSRARVIFSIFGGIFSYYWRVFRHESFTLKACSELDNSLG